MTIISEKEDQILAQQCAEHMLNNDSVSQSMGMKIVDISSGEATVSMTVTNAMLNGHKTCHGGTIFSLADSAFAFACNSQNHAAVAANCTIDFLLPAFEHDQLTAIATLYHQGRRTGIYHVTVKNQNNQKIAFFKGNSARIKRNVLPESQHTT
jgi:acyl-CoA thioesterase